MKVRRQFKTLLGAGAGGLLLVFLANAAIGAVYEVPGSYGLQEALDLATESPDDDTVLIESGVTLEGNFAYPKDVYTILAGGSLTIKGEVGDSPPVLDGKEEGPVLIVWNPAPGDVHIENLVIRNGRDELVPMFYEGGGLVIYNPSGGAVSVADVEFYNNVTSLYGGALDIYVGGVESGNILLANSRFDANEAREGGAVILRAAANDAVVLSVEVVGNSFSNNHATFNHAGALFIDAAANVGNPGGEVRVEHNVFTGNSSNGIPGALSISSAETGVFVVNNLFVNNHSDTGGTDAVQLYVGDIEPLGDVIPVVFTNNTFYRDLPAIGVHGLFISFNTLTMDARLYNNIFWSDPPGLYDFYLTAGSLPGEPDAANTLTLVSNNYLNSWIPAEYLDVYEVNYWNVDPLFADPPLDLRLVETSPLIDVGANDAPELPEIDLDGNSRITNGAVDLGAYESAPSGSLTNVDIAQFRVTKRVRLAKAKPISITLMVTNEGTTEATAQATVIGMQGEVLVYEHSEPVMLGVGSAPQSLSFPEYKPIALGYIDWTLTIDDEDPDVDDETATTEVW